ncbi:MAG: hypothetical protein FJ027_03900 [Candidatus Rokubacteria bacterium]|nr:hypothetical protein [Candidatus Rokubacteria bacterium]
MVIFGVAPDGTVVGVEPGNLDSVQLKLTQHANQKIGPRLVCDIEALECDGKVLVSIAASSRRAPSASP